VKHLKVIEDCYKLNVTYSKTEPFGKAPSLYIRVGVMPILILCRNVRCRVRFSVVGFRTIAG